MSGMGLSGLVRARTWNPSEIRSLFSNTDSLAATINAMMISVNTASENIQGDAGAQPILHWVCHLNSSEGRAGGVSRGPSWTISLVPCKMGRSRFSGGGGGDAPG